MKVKLCVSIEEDVFNAVDRFAKEWELNRSQAWENLASASLADADLLKAVGLVDLSKFVLRLQKKVKEFATR